MRVHPAVSLLRGGHCTLHLLLLQLLHCVSYQGFRWCNHGYFVSLETILASREYRTQEYNGYFGYHDSNTFGRECRVLFLSIMHYEIDCHLVIALIDTVSIAR